ncbi:MAG: FtsX-like permease family protein [Gemmatimonadetes bacterium]|nr:FtsX-like permease family protein [Gemmatimonadota bacterium]
MIKNYLTVAIRNIARHRIYSAINIIGIAIGLAFCILTYLFVHHEWTYDAFHKNADRIYRITAQEKSPFGDRIIGGVPLSLGPAISETFLNIQTVRFSNGSGDISIEDRTFRPLLGFVDPNFLDIFSFPLIHGDPANALKDKYSALITEKAAQKYFNKANPVGEPLPIQRENFQGEKRTYNYTITGILRDVPKNSTLEFEVLLPYEQLEAEIETMQRQYNHTSLQDTYILLPSDVHPNSIEQQSTKWIKNWWGESRGEERQLKLLPITQMHFNQNLQEYGISNPVYSYILSGIAILVLFIACVNFTTLTLGRQATRAREVGLRKVVGAGRMQVAKQFIGESLLLILIALITGIAIAELALPTFNNLVGLTLVGKSLSMSDGLNFTTLAFLFLLVSLVGITAGGYPAFILSRLQPTQIIASRLQMKTGNRFGNVLIIFQFALSIFLIITTLMMGKQLTFLRTQPLGYQTENIVTISTYPLEEESKTLPTVFRDALQSHHAVVSATWMDYSLTNNTGRSISYRSYKGSPEYRVENIGIDYDFFKTLGIKLVAGREFSREFPTDQKKAIIVNEAFIEKFGIKDPVGKTIQYGAYNKAIIGVVRNFHFLSLHHKIEPATMILQAWTNKLYVRIRPEDMPSTIAFIKEQWEKVAPHHAFRFSFLDENIGRQYKKEERWNQMIQYATGFAIFIATLGAFGLAALATARRTKEIGIRKVLGASQSQILSLLSREFVLYIALSSLIAFPIAYYATNQWLQTFAYRTELGIGTFLLGSVALFLIVLTTVTTQTLKAARANPADALRDE